MPGSPAPPTITKALALLAAAAICDASDAGGGPLVCQAGGALLVDAIGKDGSFGMARMLRVLTEQIAARTDLLSTVTPVLLENRPPGAVAAS